MPLQNLDNVRDLSSITPADIDSIGLVYAQKFTEDKVKTTQLRNFYSAVVSIRTKFRAERKVTPQIERDLILLKPKLAYAAGRQPRVKPFYELMKDAINTTVNVEEARKPLALQNLISITEAIVAYHKFLDPKN
ncbi:MAG: type III-A CRISPR-associated protein Csm2 [Ignavibacteriaceae bacterium]|jgi:CRISPR-associated protein Csm2|nr:type III-A CRISPR-associated protein Csm2 [Ignavibacteriaceae bacterium]